MNTQQKSDVILVQGLMADHTFAALGSGGQNAEPPLTMGLTVDLKLPCPLTSFPCGEWLAPPLSDTACKALQDKTVIIAHDLMGSTPGKNPGSDPGVSLVGHLGDDHGAHSGAHPAAYPSGQESGQALYPAPCPTSGQIDGLMALGLLVDCVRQSRPKKIGLLTPYLPYGRQPDQGSRILGRMLQAVGLDFVMTIDPHTRNPFHSIALPTIPLSGAPIFSAALAHQPINWVVSPDNGGLWRAQAWAQQWGVGWTSLSKKRHAPQVATGIDIAVHHPDPDIFNKTTCLIVDDILDSGKTLAATAAYLKNHGAATVMACITHGVFSVDCSDLLARSGLAHVWVSTSITHSEAAKPGRSGGLITALCWTRAFTPQTVWASTIE